VASFAFCILDFAAPAFSTTQPPFVDVCACLGRRPDALKSLLTLCVMCSLHWRRSPGGQLVVAFAGGCNGLRVTECLRLRATRKAAAAAGPMAGCEHSTALWSGPAVVLLPTALPMPMPMRRQWSRRRRRRRLLRCGAVRRNRRDSVGSAVARCSAAATKVTANHMHAVHSAQCIRLQCSQTADRMHVCCSVLCCGCAVVSVVQRVRRKRGISWHYARSRRVSG
jgi:hypothetical protein